MIIQGMTGTGKSYLIGSIKNALSCQAIAGNSPLLLLAPTGVATFNIHATTIHAGLQIHIKDMKPLLNWAHRSMDKHTTHKIDHTI